VSPRVVSADEWVIARKKLQAAEEEAVRALERITSQRREMPAVKIEKDYIFEGQAGQASLLDLFEGRAQLIVQHFMFDPAWEEGCPVCSYQADSVGPLSHLHARNTTYAAVSRAPIARIEQFRRRMGWSFPWYSSHGSSFNYDFHVTNDDSVAPIQYNFRTAQELADMGQPWAARPGEQGGMSVFLRDGSTVLHTWSGYGPVSYLFCETDILLDLTPLGRQDEQVELLHHDKYPEDGHGRQPA
jgi:predicted dithiol-disulfide oxidoreductase (DUF899 family)